MLDPAAEHHRLLATLLPGLASPERHPMSTRTDLLSPVAARARRLWLGLRLRLLLLALFAPLACAPPRSAADALDAAEAGYALACVALEVADAAAVVWIEAGAPTDDARRVVAGLQAAHAALVRVHDALAKGEAALDDLRDALAALELVAGLLGERAPPGLAVALAEAARLIGGAP